MKKLIMPRFLLAAALVLTFVHGPRPAYGQATGAPTSIDEHLKIEAGTVWMKGPGEPAMIDTHESATVGNAVKALQKIYPDVTFAVDPRTMDVPLSDIIIRANDPATDLEALRTASGDRFAVRFDKSANPRSTTTNPQINLLYTIRANDQTQENHESEDRVIECFNLTGYIQHALASRRMMFDQDSKPSATGETKATDEALAHLQEIIKSTISDFDGSIKLPHFRFYREAQLLIITGSRDAIGIAAKVINALPGQQNAISNSAVRRNKQDQTFLEQISPVFAPDKTTAAPGADPSRP
jgi:hypothetical protein